MVIRMLSASSCGLRLLLLERSLISARLDMPVAADLYADEISGCRLHHIMGMLWVCNGYVMTVIFKQLTTAIASAVWCVTMYAETIGPISTSYDVCYTRGRSTIGQVTTAMSSRE